MKAGHLRHRVQLQRPANPSDGAGEFVESWTTQATVAAAIEPVSGRDFIRNEKLTGTVSHLIRHRWTSQATPAQGWRVLWGNRVFNVTSAVNVDERDREVQLLALEGTPL